MPSPRRRSDRHRPGGFRGGGGEMRDIDFSGLLYAGIVCGVLGTLFVGGIAALIWWACR